MHRPVYAVSGLKDQFFLRPEMQSGLHAVLFVFAACNFHQSHLMNAAFQVKCH
jgi:hypothetical protein